MPPPGYGMLHTISLSWNSRRMRLCDKTMSSSGPYSLGFRDIQSTAGTSVGRYANQM
jgi:hypothetical protein